MKLEKWTLPLVGPVVVLFKVESLRLLINPGAVPFFSEIGDILGLVPKAPFYSTILGTYDLFTVLITPINC
jgi:hypothetical protein